MGLVWLARMVGSVGFEKPVAFKSIRPSYARSERFQRMFLDESHISAQVRHPNVVELLDVGGHRGVLDQVLEWIDGDCLSVLLRVAQRRNPRLPTSIVLRIAAQLCAGLHAAHRAPRTAWRSTAAR